MGRGGRRPGAGRKPKNPEEKLKRADKPIALEEQVANLLHSKTSSTTASITTKKLAHELAYVKQELEFIKKIILASIEGK